MREIVYTLVILLSAAAAIPALAADLRVEDFGARGDGKANDAPAIQKALDAAAAAGGGRVLLGPREYRLNASINVPTGVILAGIWDGPHFTDNRSLILATANAGEEDGPALIRLNTNSTVRGVTIYYPDERLEKVIPYPWTIQVQAHQTNSNVIDVTLVNPTKGIDVGTHPNELHFVRNVFGCPLQVGVYIDRTTDIGRVENVHFNPNFWARTNLPNRPNHPELIEYLGKNLIAFDIGRSDWEYILNTFSFGAKIGYRFFESPSGPTNGNFLGIAADWATTGILIEQTQAPGLLITNGEFVGNPSSETVIDVRGTHTGLVTFSNTAFWGPHKQIARIDGTGRVQFTACNFVQWDIVDHVGLPAIEVLNGDVDISHSYFREDKPQITLGENVMATIVGNQMRGGVRITNNSKQEVYIAGNLSRKPPPAD